MAGNVESFEEAAADTQEGKADRSTIDFPYLDLDNAVAVAKAVYEQGGLGRCEIDELAAQMKQTVSGAFRLKTATAKTFGLIDKDGRSGFKLSELGQRIVGIETESEARAAAFLSVPLYKAVYERYRGKLLPPPKALEREMSGFGVIQNQADRARQVFQRSAQQAGFFLQGDDRLVQPRFDRETLSAPTPSDAAEITDSTKLGGSDGGGGLDLDPLLIAVLRLIPTASQGWPASKRLRWFKTFAMNVSQVYDGDNEPVELKIELEASHTIQ